MWAETFKYLSVIHIVNHHPCSRHRDRRGWEKEGERRKRRGGGMGVKKRRGEQMTEWEWGTLSGRQYTYICVRGAAAAGVLRLCHENQCSSPWLVLLCSVDPGALDICAVTLKTSDSLQLAVIDLTEMCRIWHLIDTCVCHIGGFKALHSTCLVCFHFRQWFSVCQRAAFNTVSQEQVWTCWIRLHWLRDTDFVVLLLKCPVTVLTNE